MASLLQEQEIEITSAQEIEQENVQTPSQKPQKFQGPRPPYGSKSDNDEDEDGEEEDDDDVSKFSIVPRAKRALAEEEQNESPKIESRRSSRRRVVKDSGEASREVGHGRVFSDKDEISLFEKLFEFKEKMGIDPIANKKEFVEFVYGGFPIKLSKEQFKQKIRRLNYRFLKQLEKGEDSLTTPHLRKCFEFSKILFGGEVAVDEQVIAEGKEVKEEKEEDLHCKYPNLMRSFDLGIGTEYERKFMMEHIGKLDSEKAKELDGNWEGCFMREIHVGYESLKFKKDLAELVIKTRNQ